MDVDRTQPKGARKTVSPTELETLNFKVPVAFKRTFKSYAAQEGISMLALLKEGFELSKSKRGAK